MILIQLHAFCLFLLLFFAAILWQKTRNVNSSVIKNDCHFLTLVMKPVAHHQHLCS